MTEPITRPATLADVPAIAAVHERAFAGFFLTSMGRRFLEAYYRLVLAEPDGIVMLAVRDDETAGFVAGTADPARFYGRMSRSRRALLGPIFIGLLRRPWLLRRVVSNAQRARRLAAASPEIAADLAELTSIGVDPEGGGRGIGSALVEAFVAAARDAGVGGVRLTTDCDDNEGVNEFYRRRGFALHATFEAVGGRLMNEYRRLV